MGRPNGAAQAHAHTLHTCPFNTQPCNVCFLLTALQRPFFFLYQKNGRASFNVEVKQPLTVCMLDNTNVHVGTAPSWYNNNWGVCFKEHFHHARTRKAKLLRMNYFKIWFSHWTWSDRGYTACASCGTLILRRRKKKSKSLKFDLLFNSASNFQIVWACLLSGH